MTPQIVGLLMTFAAGIIGVTLYIRNIKADGDKDHGDVTKSVALVNEAVETLAVRVGHVEGKADGTDREVTGPQNAARLKLEGQLALLAMRVENTPTKADFAVVATKLDTLIEQGKKRS